MKSVAFQLDGQDGAARATTIQLTHGEVQTPVFMPVGTQGAIRSVAPDRLPDAGVQILLANTYHLSQRPGEALVAKHGGLHDFMKTDLPILTDSGGFQVFSLEKTVTEEGVTFNYEVDGKQTFLSPERSMEIQQALGADVAMVFDECIAFGTERKYAEASVDRTTRWESRSKDAHTRPDQALFGIVQGGFWPDLRKKSAHAIAAIGFDGYAIGGLSVGEGHQVMCDVLDHTTPHMPTDAPRYLMGVGRPVDLVEGVARGVDMFDCVIQTRHARSGVCWTNRGRVRLTDRRYKNDMYGIDPTCSCYTCTNFSRAYLHHLFKVGEILAATLASIHNIHWFQTYMREMRQAILDGRFQAFREEVHAHYPPERDRKGKKADAPKKKRGGRGGSRGSGRGGRGRGGGRSRSR
jgi:queuine tRNA-ribosyltransferase